MARSPESAQAKDAAAADLNHPPKEESKGRLLKGPDGFVYVHSDALAAQPGFVEFIGEVDAGGFAVVPPAKE